MKMEKNIEKFIELRITGNSFDAIAKELHTSKQTLIEWNKKFEVRSAISEGKALKIHSLVRANHFSLETRLTSYMQLSKKINAELLNRDLSEIETSALLKMSISNDSRITDLTNANSQIGQNQLVIDCGSDADGFFQLVPGE